METGIIDKGLYYDWAGLNLWLFKVINSFHSDDYDMAMVLISRFAEHENLPYYIGILLAYVLLSILGKAITKRAGINGFSQLWIGVFVTLIVGVMANGMVIKTTKQYFEYPRPYVTLSKSEVNVLESVPQEKAYKSFPSGHMAFITVLVFALWPALSAGMRWVGVAAITLTGWSRIALGVHFPADVVGGFLISMLVMSIVSTVVYRILHKMGVKC